MAEVRTPAPGHDLLAMPSYHRADFFGATLSIPVRRFANRRVSVAAKVHSWLESDPPARHAFGLDAIGRPALVTRIMKCPSRVIYDQRSLRRERAPIGLRRRATPRKVASWATWPNATLSAGVNSQSSSIESPCLRLVTRLGALYPPTVCYSALPSARLRNNRPNYEAHR